MVPSFPRGYRIPQNYLQAELALLWTEIVTAVEDVLQSGQFILGPQVEAFEEEVAAFLDVKYAVGVSSGTDALIIALHSAGIGPGDEVITTPFTFFATAEAISRVGGQPVFVDIDARTFNLNPDLVSAVLSARTKAILPVHLYGQAADLTPLLDIAASYGLKIIEDVAQAFGGEYGGKKLGTFGDVGCFSFFPTKILGGVGDGGLIVTNSAEIAELARLLRVHGSPRKYFHTQLGYNARLDELQAAVLRVKLPHVPEWIELIRAAAQEYTRQLSGLPGIITPWESSQAKHVYHQYTLRIEQGRRDAVRQYLASAGIDTTVYYPYPLHRLPVYRESASLLPEAEKAAREVLSLPLWPLISRETINAVTAALKSWVDSER
jgi:dTDP-4-amino-4,6-dideoxygalactose transaminase